MPFDAFDYPSALSNLERKQFRNAVERHVEQFGMARQLQASIETAVEQYTAVVSLIFTEMRSDLQAAHMRVGEDMKSAIEKEHQNFLVRLDNEMNALEGELSGLKADQKAWEAHEARRKQLDQEHQERTQKLLNDHEEATRELMQRIVDFQVESDPERKQLLRDVRSIATENAKLKTSISAAYREAKDIGFLNVKRPKERILQILRKHV